MFRTLLFLGSVNAAISVGMGAFGAHALKDRLSEPMLAVFHTGAHYHFLHSLGLLAIGLASAHLGVSGLLKGAAILMTAGFFVAGLALLATVEVGRGRAAAVAANGGG